MYEPPKPPDELKDPGRQLWERTVSEIEFSAHELEILHEAGKTLDALRALQERLDRDGLSCHSSQGEKAHWALSEMRAQRLALIRLLGSIEIPAPPEDA
jgi:hypothetical protein